MELLEEKATGFDFDGFLASFEGDHESVDMVIQVFLDTYPEDVRKLREAGLRGDRALLVQMSRHLRDSLAYFRTRSMIADLDRLGLLAESALTLKTRHLAIEVSKRIEAFGLELASLRPLV